MRELLADEVAIDALGRLIVRPVLPSGEEFEFIYRAAMQVAWDPVGRCLVTPIPQEWSSARWFKQVADALRGEYHRCLVVSADTRWSNVPPLTRAEIEAGFRSEPAV